MIIVKKFGKWGKKAELLSFYKSPKQDVEADKADHGSNPNIDKDCCRRCAAISDSDSDDDDDGHVPAVKPKKSNAKNITWQHPDLTNNKEIKTKSKGQKGFFGWCCFKVGEGKKKMDTVNMSGKKYSMAEAPSKCQFPRTPMSEYASPNPYYRPFEHYPLPMMGRPSAAPPLYHHPFGLMAPPPPPLVPPPPPPPSCGFFNSRSPPKIYSE
ncbi:hypothetical protein DITRI_Ditri14bG0008300 [Diplodiscus trichospermus]